MKNEKIDNWTLKCMFCVFTGILMVFITKSIVIYILICLNGILIITIVDIIKNKSKKKHGKRIKTFSIRK